MKKTNVPDEFSNAASILQRYDNTEFATEQFQAVGVPVTTDFTDLRIRNGKYVSCTFKGNSFMNTGAAETKFTTCNFAISLKVLLEIIHLKHVLLPIPILIKVAFLMPI